MSDVQSKIVTINVPCVIRGEEAERLLAERDAARAAQLRAERRRREQAWGEAMADRLQIGGIMLLCGMVLALICVAMGRIL